MSFSDINNTLPCSGQKDTDLKAAGKPDIYIYIYIKRTGTVRKSVILRRVHVFIVAVEKQ